MKKRLLLPILLIAFGSSLFAAAATEISVAAASDLNFALKEIATRYQHDTGNRIKLSFGSSGNFFNQIESGAPYDVFLSADVGYPRKLTDAGLVDRLTIYRYAVGKIVLWVPNGSKLDLNRGMDLLLDPAVKKIAIANPAHAPYGRAAEQALKLAGSYDRVKSKLVFGENISQAAQFVQSGNADIGIVAQSLAVSPTMKSAGRYVAVPSVLYSPIEQGAVVLKSSHKQAAARAFIDYLKQPAAGEIMKKYGFSVPAE